MTSTRTNAKNDLDINTEHKRNECEQPISLNTKTKSFNDPKNKAAKKILFWYRNRKTKLSKPFFVAINELRLATDDDIRNHKYDELLDHCIEHCRIFNNRAGLQLLGYTLFSGNRNLLGAGNYFYCLLILLHDPQSTISDVAKALKDTFNDWYGQSKQELSAKGRCQRSLDKRREQTQRDPHYFWGNTRGVKRDDIVSISHGGGFYHIIDFLRHRSPGYHLEGPGLGIQVSPVDMGRDLHYAYTRSVFHCDLPATLQADVPAQYLDAAVNEYEAGLRSECTPFLRNISIEIHKPVWLGILDYVLKECYQDDTKFKERVIKSAKNLEGIFKEAHTEALQYRRR